MKYLSGISYCQTIILSITKISLIRVSPKRSSELQLKILKGHQAYYTDWQFFMAVEVSKTVHEERPC